MKAQLEDKGRSSNTGRATPEIPSIERPVITWTADSTEDLDEVHQGEDVVKRARSRSSEFIEKIEQIEKDKFLKAAQSIPQVEKPSQILQEKHREAVSQAQMARSQSTSPKLPKFNSCARSYGMTSDESGERIQAIVDWLSRQSSEDLSKIADSASRSHSSMCLNGTGDLTSSGEKVHQQSREWLTEKSLSDLAVQGHSVKLHELLDDVLNILYDMIFHEASSVDVMASLHKQGQENEDATNTNVADISEHAILDCVVDNTSCSKLAQTKISTLIKDPPTKHSKGSGHSPGPQYVAQHVSYAENKGKEMRKTFPRMQSSNKLSESEETYSPGTVKNMVSMFETKDLRKRNFLQRHRASLKSPVMSKVSAKPAQESPNSWYQRMSDGRRAPHATQQEPHMFTTQQGTYSPTYDTEVHLPSNCTYNITKTPAVDGGCRCVNQIVPPFHPPAALTVTPCGCTLQATAASVPSSLRASPTADQVSRLIYHLNMVKIFSLCMYSI